MAIYKRDMVDIDLSTGNIYRSFAKHSIGTADNKANRFGVRVFRNGEAVDLGGVSVQGFFRDPQGNNIAITSGNSVSGNVAEVVLPQACYNYEGQFCLAIKLVGGGVTGTMRIVDGIVDNTNTGGAVAPTGTVPTYQEIIAQYDAMVAGTAAVNNAIDDLNDIKKSLAGPADSYSTTNNLYIYLSKALSTSKTYLLAVKVGTSGTYTIQTSTVATGSGIVDTLATYQAMTANVPVYFTYKPSAANVQYIRISSDSIAWYVDVSEIIDGVEFSSLKSTFEKESGLAEIQFNGPNQYIKTNLAVGATVNTTPQTSAGFRYAIVPCTAGDKFTVTATGGQSPRVWCWTDANYKVIAVDPTLNHTVTNLVLTAPSNAAYLILNDNSSSKSYKGTSRITDAENAISALDSKVDTITGGEYETIPADTNLDNFVTPGNYYTATSGIASSIINSPLTIPFKLHNEYSLPGTTRRITQTVEPCYGQTVNRVQYVRIVDTQTSPTRWFCVATADTATESTDGLMSKYDKIRLDGVENPGNLENIEFPSVITSVADLLRIEKTYCVLHDNFSRADNASEIGYNGSGTFKMAYTAMGSNSLNVGISNKKAVSSGGSSGNVALRVKTLDSIPYKACVSFDSLGKLVVSPTDGSNYILLSFTPNAVSISGVGNAVCTGASVTHNGNCSDATVYVYSDKIRVYVADEFVLETDATIQNAVCGLYFAYGEANVYTNFDLFLPTHNIPVGLDNAVEKCGSPSSAFLGFMAQADSSYGITFNSETTRNSLKSLRFEQRKADSMGGTYRSEITPPYMRPRNYPLQTKIFSFDIYFPSDYDYDSRADVLWQMHHTPDNVNPDAMYPNISFSTMQGKMWIETLTYADKATDASDPQSTRYDIGEVEKGTWKHFDVFLREGYLPQHNPATAVYMDGVNVVLSRIPNGYNTTEGSYLKMGMYKSAWTSQTTETSVRVVYFDNIKIWQ